MSYNAFLLETLGSVFIVLVSIMFIMYLYGRLVAKCFGKSGSATTQSSSSRRAVAGTQSTTEPLAPPPSYDELFCGHIFVIQIEDEEKSTDVADTNMHDEQLPTYDEAIGFSLPS